VRVAASAPLPPSAPTATQAVAGPAKSDSAFSVQVGAYRSEKEAQRHLVSVISTLPQQLGALDPYVTHFRNRNSSILYRARLVGFDTREDAARTCNWLKNRSTDCLIVTMSP